jgi:hypothetical protein
VENTPPFSAFDLIKTQSMIAKIFELIVEANALCEQMD